MSEQAISRQYSPKYKPARDRDRMQKYMATLRSKDKAGFKHLTVKEYRNFLALLENDELQAK